MRFKTATTFKTKNMSFKLNRKALLQFLCKINKYNMLMIYNAMGVEGGGREHQGTIT